MFQHQEFTISIDKTLAPGDAVLPLDSASTCTYVHIKTYRHTHIKVIKIKNVSQELSSGAHL